MPQPLASDIEVLSDGSLAVGIKDRHGDMVLSGMLQILLPGVNVEIFDVGLPLGGALVARSENDGWAAPVSVESEWPRRHEGYRGHWPQGGLAAGITPRFFAGASAYVEWGVRVPEWQAMTHVSAAPDAALQDTAQACLLEEFRIPSVQGSSEAHAAPAPVPVLDNEGRTVSVVPPPPGDLEMLCARELPPTPTPIPSATPTPSATGTPMPSPSATPRPSATPTLTATPGPTATPAPIALPIALAERPCLRQRPRLDVILILDASTSMKDLTRAGRRKIDAALAAARAFGGELDLRPSRDQVALVTFNEQAALRAPLGSDPTAFETALDRVELQQYTRIDLGLSVALEELQGPRRRETAVAAVVLLTDGRSNPVPVSEAVIVAEEIKAVGARLFAIGLGEDVERDALRGMATRPEDYFEAPDGEDLAAIYERISAALPCPPLDTWPAR